MSSHARGPHRRYRKNSGRSVLVLSELNHDLRPEQVGKIITAADLEQARLEAAAQADARAEAQREAEEAGHA